MAIGVSGGVSAMTSLVTLHNKAQERHEQRRSNQAGIQDPGTEKSQVSGDDEAIIATTEKFLNSVDELSAFAANFRNRRHIEERDKFFAESLDRVLDDDAPEKVERLMGLLKGSARGNTALLMQFARKAFPDQSDLIAVLRHLLRSQSLSQSERATLEDILEAVEEDADTRMVKAGINVALKARLFGRKLQLNPSTVRMAYRNFIESDAPERELYEEWVTFFGASKRHIVIDFMEHAVMTDLDASDPSSSDAEFGYLLKRLSQIKLIRSVDFIFIKNIEKNSFVSGFNTREDNWLFFLLSILKDPDCVYATLYETGGTRLSIASATDKVRFIQTIYRYSTGFPGAIFNSDEDRERFLSNLRELIARGHEKELLDRPDK